MKEIGYGDKYSTLEIGEKKIREWILKFDSLSLRSNNKLWKV